MPRQLKHVDREHFMLAYLSGVWQSRYFWFSLVRMDLQSRYRHSVLGIGWSLLHPITQSIVICAIFPAILNVELRVFVPHLMSGLACWAYITGATMGGCQCFVQAESYIRQHPLPMAIYPLRTTLGLMFHFLVALLLVIAVSWFFNRVNLVFVVVAVMPGIFVFIVFGWSVGVLAGYINTIFRDVQHVTEIAFQILFYLTPIIYMPEHLKAIRAPWLLTYNPLHHFMEMLRQPLRGGLPTTSNLFVVMTLTLMLFVAAAALLKPLQRRIIFYL